MRRPVRTRILSLRIARLQGGQRKAPPARAGLRSRRRRLQHPAGAHFGRPSTAAAINRYNGRGFENVCSGRPSVFSAVEFRIESVSMYLRCNRGSRTAKSIAISVLWRGQALRWRSGGCSGRFCIWARSTTPIEGHFELAYLTHQIWPSPEAVSCCVCRSAAPLISAPNSTTNTDNHIQVSRTNGRPNEPYVLL
jgi:hypothetical protein